MAVTFDQLRTAKSPFMTIPGLVLPPGITPYPHQYVDAAYMLLQPRCMLAEYTAAGKKLTVIMAYLKAVDLGRATNMLVLATGDDVDQWIEELDMFAPSLRYAAYRGTPKQRKAMRDVWDQWDILVCTHQTAANDNHIILNRSSIVTVDEASILRNYDTHLQPAIACLTASSKAEQAAYFRVMHDRGKFRFRPTVQEIPREPAQFVWPLTATPYETGPLNVWSAFNVILGRRSPLGPSGNAFKKTFCIVKKFKIKQRTKTGKDIKVSIEKVTGIKPHLKDDVGDRIKPYYVRHPWQEVAAHLPRVIAEPVWLDMTNAQRERYRELTENNRLVFDYIVKERGRLPSGMKDVSAGVRCFYQLRCCDGLFSLPAQSKNDSPKIRWVVSKLTGELGSEKVVIFSKWYAPLDRLETQLAYNDIETLRIDGNPQRTDEMNTAARRSFMDPKGPRVLLITPKAIRALNLQIANYMICFNVIYNPKAMEQLFGRIARPKPDGSLEPVIAFLLGMKASAEETLFPLAREREAEAGDLFGNKDEFFQSLTPSERDAVIAYAQTLDP